MLFVLIINRNTTKIKSRTVRRVLLIKAITFKIRKPL